MDSALRLPSKATAKQVYIAAVGLTKVDLSRIPEIRSETASSTGSGDPIHVALLSIDGRRVFVELDHTPEEGESLEGLLAGQTLKLLVKHDGDYYCWIPRSRSLDIGLMLESIRRRVDG